MSGISLKGTGIYGSSTAGVGVYASSAANDGVHGGTTGNGRSGVSGWDTSPGGGYGVYASSLKGTALHVQGKATFSRSGAATIAKGKTSVTVGLAEVTASSLVLATLQQFVEGSQIAAAVPATNAFTIYLNEAATADTRVAWFVLD